MLTLLQVSKADLSPLGTGIPLLLSLIIQTDQTAVRSIPKTAIIGSHGFSRVAAAAAALLGTHDVFGIPASGVCCVDGFYL
jgi:hypothetical protein